jgi:putative flippase GtrA
MNNQKSSKASKFFNIFFSGQFLKFILAGGIAASFNFFSRFLFELFLPFIASVALGYTVGTIVSFFLNKVFTFKAYDEHPALQFFKFAIAAPLGIFLGSIIVFLIMKIYKASNINFINEEYIKSATHLIAIGLTTIYSFIVIKYFCFKKVNAIKKLYNAFSK